MEYNANTLEIDTTELFTAGWYFLGVGHSFIVYPKTLQSVKFTEEGGNPIVARTKEGLLATLDISFNYKLQISIGELSQLYLSFGEMDDVQIAYNRIARNWVRVVSAQYTAREFFFNRSQIQSDMQRTLDDQLRLAHGQVDNLQFLRLQLPPTVEDAQNRQVTAQEEVDEARNNRDVASIEATTRVTRAKEEASVIVLSAEAAAQQVQFETDAKVDAARRRYAAESESYDLLAKNLGLSPDELLAYIWLDMQRSSSLPGSVTALQKPKSLIF